MISEMSADTLCEMLGMAFGMAICPTLEDRKAVQDAFISDYGKYIHTDEDENSIRKFFAILNRNAPPSVVQSSVGEEG